MLKIYKPGQRPFFDESAEATKAHYAKLGYTVEELTDAQYQTAIEEIKNATVGTTIDDYLLDLDFRLSKVELGI